MKYQDIGHRPGAVLWWTDGRSFGTYVSTDKMEMHHTLCPDLNMDMVWRGRAVQGWVVTVLPPLRIYKRPEVPILPQWLLRRFIEFKPKYLLVDTPMGLKNMVGWQDGLKRHVSPQKGLGGAGAYLYPRPHFRVASDMPRNIGLGISRGGSKVRREGFRRAGPDEEGRTEVPALRQPPGISPGPGRRL